MLADVSPYGRAAANLRDNGYSPMPIQPGTKTPGVYSDGHWRPMPGWQKYCKSPAPEFVHSNWENWPAAGVCIAHGTVIGLDLDTDREDVADAVRSAVAIPEVRRRGRKGWMGYFRPAADLDDGTARLRWYDPKDGEDARPLVELLLHGTQSVLPPTIHPETQRPYEWLGAALTNTDISELDEFGQTDLARLEAAFAAIGLTRQAPRRANLKDYDRPEPGGADLEKPFGRSLNDRALRPSAMDRWWPALDMPKTRQRGVGAWEAVAFWRSSGSGRAVQDRNPNLRSVPNGIVDFGSDRAYTPIDVVMAARDCSYPAAVEWLEQYVEPEAIVHMDITAPAPLPREAEPTPAPAPSGTWSSIPVFPGARSFGPITPVLRLTEAEFRNLIPADPGSFPIADPAQCGGLLGELASYMDRASNTASEAGGLAVALPLLGALMGRAWQTPTGLRTNIYTVSIGSSGDGKTSLVSPAKELLTLCKATRNLGADRYSSAQGLLKMLRDEHPKISFLDEFGHMLSAITSSNAGVHQKAILTELTQLYSAANTTFTGIASASQEIQPLDSPHLCLFGMATTVQFWSAFGSGALEDGSVARYIVMPLGETYQKDPDKSFQDELVSQLGLLIASAMRLATGNLGRLNTATVPFDDAAEAERRKLVSTMSACARFAEDNGIKGAAPILKRVAENASKIALVSGVGRNFEKPAVEKYDFDIGHAIARWSACTMISNIAQHIADNQHERYFNAIEATIRKAGKAGILQGKAKDSHRYISKREFSDIIESMQDSGLIEKTKTSSKMKPGWLLRYAKED